jgi:hypothetical protein
MTIGIIIEPRTTNNRRNGEIIETDPNTGRPIKTAGLVPVESMLLSAEATIRQRQAEENKMRQQYMKYCCAEIKQAIDEGFVVQDGYPNSRYLIRDLRTADIVFEHDLKFCPFCMKPLVLIY